MIYVHQKTEELFRHKHDGFVFVKIKTSQQFLKIALLTYSHFKIVKGMFIDTSQLVPNGKHILGEGDDMTQVGIVGLGGQSRGSHVSITNRLDLLNTTILCILQYLK